MASITNTYDENNDTVFEVDPGDDTEVALATANTYVDKNIVFKLPENNFIKTVNGTEPDEDGNVEIDVENEINLIDLDEQGVSIPVFKITELPVGLTKFYSSSSKTYTYISFEYNLKESASDAISIKKQLCAITSGLPGYFIVSNKENNTTQEYNILVFTKGHVRNFTNTYKKSLDTWEFDNISSVVSKGSISEAPNNLNILYQDNGQGIWAPLPDFAKASDIPTLTSQLTNDSGFLTEHQDISGKANVGDSYTKEESDGKYKSKEPYIVNFKINYTTKTASLVGCTFDDVYAMVEADPTNVIFLEDGEQVYALDYYENFEDEDWKGIDLIYASPISRGFKCISFYADKNGVHGDYKLEEFLVPSFARMKSTYNPYAEEDLTTKKYVDDQLATKQSTLVADTDYLTPTTADSTYQPIGDYLTEVPPSAVYVNVTLSGRFPNKTVTSVDKTYEEITTLMQSGVNIYLQGDGTYFSLIEYYGDGSYFCFQSIDGSSASYEYIFIYNDNSYDYDAGNWVKETTLTYELGKKLPIPSYNNGGLFITPNAGQVLSYKSGDLDKSSSYEWTDLPSTDGLASETYVDTKVSDLVNSAPETLDTLNELATALGNDSNFATTIATQIGNKVDKEDGKGLFSYKAEDITDVGVYQTNLSGELVPVDDFNNQADFNQAAFEQINNIYEELDSAKEIFVVTATEKENENDGIATASDTPSIVELEIDCTIQELIDAYNNGKYIVCHYDSNIFRLIGVQSVQTPRAGDEAPHNAFYFTCDDGNRYQQLRIMSEDNDCFCVIEPPVVLITSDEFYQTLNYAIPFPTDNNYEKIVPTEGQVLAYKDGDISYTSSYEWVDLPTNNGKQISIINQDGTMTVEELLELKSGLYFVENAIYFYYEKSDYAQSFGLDTSSSLATSDIYGLIQLDNIAVENGQTQAITIYNAGMFVAIYDTSHTSSPHSFFREAGSLDKFGEIEFGRFTNILDEAFEQTLKRPQSDSGEYDDGIRGQVLASTGGETPEWIDLPTQSDIEVATVEETLEYLAITIPDLSEEEF